MLSLELDKEVCKCLPPLVCASGEGGFVVSTAYPFSENFCPGFCISDAVHKMWFTRPY